MGDWWELTGEERKTVLLLEVVGLLHDLGKLSDRFLKSQAQDQDYRYAYEFLSDPMQVFLIRDELRNLREKTSNRRRVRQLLKTTSLWPNPDIATELLSQFDRSKRTTERVDRITKELEELVSAASSPGEAKFVVEGVKAAFEMLDWLDIIEDVDHDAPFREQAALTQALDFTLNGWDQQIYSLAELLPITAPRHIRMEWASWLGKAMEPAKLVGYLHGVSHYEKEEPPDNKQPYQDMYRASPFGHEERIPVETDQGLSEDLKALPLDRITDVLTDKRQKWLREMQALMECGISDTRRPTNEVTLWDWGYTVASFVKAALPFILHRGWPTDLNTLSWRVLRVNIDLLGLYGKAHKITDLLGSQTVVNGAFTKVKTLLEETYPIANELYRDVTGIYFIFPDFDLPDELKEQILHCFDPDLRPIIELSSEAIRAGDLDPKKKKWAESAKLIARPREKALKALERPIRTDNLYTWEMEWRGAEAEICTACGLRPVGYPQEGSEAEKALHLSEWADQEKAEGRHICRICLDRRGRRSKDWVTGGLKETIWTDEVADFNGRLALVVGKFDLDGWLDGTLVQTVAVGKKKQPTKGQSPARLRRIWETTQAFWEAVPHLRDERDRPVLPPTGPRLEIRGSFVPDDPRRRLGVYHAYELNLGATTLSMVWEPPHKEQGGRFISVDNLAYAAKQQGWTVPEQQKDEDRDSYDRRQAREAARWLIGQLDGARSFVIEEPVGYGGKNKRLGLLTKVRASELEGEYTPIVSILSEPSRFMALVPASRALDVAQAIKSKYEGEMGKVRDRLPLHLGLVFAPRRTPLRAVLEAGQAMLATVQEDWTERGQMWEVLSIQHHEKTLDDGQKVTKQVDLVLAVPSQGTDPKPDQVPRTVDWSVRTVMGDGKIYDSWYPHLLTKKPTKPQKPEEELKLSKVHIAELEQCAKVWVRPSRFDFEFLDTSARRFDVNYDEHSRRCKRPTRPYLLEDLKRLDELWSLMQHLETTQINAIGGTIEAARRDWGVGWGDEAERDRVFCRFVEDTLAGANWPREMRWCDIDQTERDNLVTAAVRGELTDVLELRMEILKQRPEWERRR